MTLNKTFFSKIAACVIAFSMLCSFAACGKSSSSATYADDYEFQDESSSSADSYLSDDANGQSLAEISSRMLIRNASFEIETKNYQDTVSKIEDTVKRFGGYIEALNENDRGRSEYARRYANYVLRIPADSLDSFMTEISDNFTVISRSIEVEDITDAYIDTESRMNALKTEQETLLGLLEKAQSLSDVLEIQDRLAQVRGDIESYEAILKSYDSQIGYSSVTVSVDEVEVETDVSDSFWGEAGSRISKGFSNVGYGLRSFAIWIIGAVPYWILLAAAAAVVIIVRLCIKKRRKNKGQKNRGESPEILSQTDFSDPGGKM